MANRNRTRDHLIPLAKGGATIAANMVHACGSCNRDKQNMTLEEYRIWLEGKKSVDSYYLRVIDSVDRAIEYVAKNREILMTTPEHILKNREKVRLRNEQRKKNGVSGIQQTV